MDYEIDDQSWGSKIKNGLIELIEFIAIIGAILIVIRFFVAEPHKVSGSSMVPNFHDGDYIITNKLAMRFSPPERGEVVILQNPKNPDQVFIKRIIALPGEQINISGGQVYINNNPLSEPYLPSGTSTQAGAFLVENEAIVIPDGQYFLMGDNRNGSSDSREWGLVRKELLIGQALFRYWPPQKFNLIKISQASD